MKSCQKKLILVISCFLIIIIAVYARLSTSNDELLALVATNSTQKLSSIYILDSKCNVYLQKT